jgi:hypothetical protein
MTNKRKLITFDWAIKRLLRSKANFGILEGFLSELLKEASRSWMYCKVKDIRTVEFIHLIALI